MKTALLILSGLLLSAGCADRNNLTASHGQSYRQALSRQAANPQAGQEGPSKGLDSQEAAVIANSYRTSLARKGEKPPQETLLMVAPPTRTVDNMPAASVPPER